MITPVPVLQVRSLWCGTLGHPVSYFRALVYANGGSHFL